MEELLASTWRHFKNICKYPHKSKAEDEVRKYVHESIRNMQNVTEIFYDEHATSPGKRVIVARKNSPRSTEPRFVLQGHLDMVCDPPNMKFPLTLISNNGWTSAKDANGVVCTLGADNGIGVAAMLALLESKIDFGTFECLFTVEEEIGMPGAKEFDKDLIKSRILLNLDTEEVDFITYGCAGALDTDISVPLHTESITKELKPVFLKIHGLKGGHSGIDINKGSLNAIKLLAECLKQLNLKYRFNISKFEGGTYNNKIPGQAEAVIILPGEELTNFLQECNQLKKEIMDRYRKVEPNLGFDFHQFPEPHPNEMFDNTSSKRLLGILNAIPHGVLKMDPDNPSQVMTSNNLGIVNASSEKPNPEKIICLHRSSSEQEIDRVYKELEKIALSYGSKIKCGEKVLPWQPNAQSGILKIAKKVYGANGKLTVIHAGLECGVIFKKYEGQMDCVSIGPTIRDAHNPGEAVNEESVKVFLTRLLGIIKILKGDE